jgi:phytoene synthase
VKGQGRAEQPIAADYCAELLRRFDRDRYAMALFAPQQARAALFALGAFNHEVAKTAEVVSDPTVGQIRLQWWRLAIEAIYAGTPPDHPVVTALARVVDRHGLPRAPFDNLIDAREADLDPTPPADMTALEGYAAATAGGLVRLGLQAVAGAADPAAAQAAEHAGIAWGLTGLLRAVPFHARARRLHLPADLLHRHGVAARDVLELRAPEGLPAVVQAVSDRAAEHVARARAGQGAVGRRGVPALLPATVAAIDLRRLRRAGFQPHHPRLAEPRRFLGWRLAAALLSGRY